MEIIKKNRLTKIALLFVTVITLILLSGVNSVVTLESKVVSESVFVSIINSRKESKHELFETILLDELPLIFDFNDHRAYYSIPSNPDEQPDFNPSVKLRSDQKIDIAFIDKEVSWELIGNNMPISFVIFNENEFQLFDLVITTLPLVEIRLNQSPENPDKPIPDHDVYGSITVLDNQNTKSILNKVFQSDVVCHTRGSSSLLYPQNSYRLSLKYDSLGINERKNQKSLLGMDWDDDWILYASYNDPEKIRNTLSTNLWWEWGAKNNKFGMSNGTQGKIVELFIEDRYWGLYTLMKPITASKLLLQGNEHPGMPEYYFRTISYDQVSHELFMDEPDFIPEGSTRPTVGRFELRYPKNPKPGYEKWASLDELTQVLEEDYEIFAYEIFNLVDKQSSIDLWLYLKTTMAFDNRGKNLNYIAKRDGDKYVF